VVKELLGAGHQVLGLARSDSGAKALAEAGTEVHRGDVNDLENIRSGAAKSDAVVHTAFNHDFSKYVENCESDRKVIEALGSALVGSEKLLIVTSGAAMAKSGAGKIGSENDPPASSKQVPRAASEEAAAAVAARGVRVAVVRLSQIHDRERQGLVTYAIQVACEKGVSAYVGNGQNRWSAAPRFDTARLYRLALEKTGKSAMYHAVAEEGVSVRDIATAIGSGLKVPVVSLTPEQAAEHSAGSVCLRDWIFHRRARRREKSWDGTPPGRA